MSLLTTTYKLSPKMYNLLTILVVVLLTTTYNLQPARAFIGPSPGQIPGQGGGLFQVTSDRNVGFGTSAPKPTNTAESSAWGHVFTVASTSNPGLGLLNTGTGGKHYLLYSKDGGAFGIFDATAGAVRLRIQSNGNIGIGGTNPASSTLHVFGNVQADGSFIGALSGSLSAANVSSDVFGRLQGNGNFAFPASVGVATSSQSGLPQPLSVYGNAYISGNVGIGTASPSRLLHLKAGEPYIEFEGTAIAKAYRIGNGDGNLYFTDGTTGVPTITIDDAKVGIGTTGPGSPLHVAGATTGASGYTARFTDSNTNAGATVLVAWTGGALNEKYKAVFVDSEGLKFGKVVDALNALASPQMTIAHDGKVGIGKTSPAAKLDIAITTEWPFRIHDTVDDSDIRFDVDAGSFRIYTGTTTTLSEKVRIESGGNVGIGDTTPTEGKLVVSGTGFFTSTVTVGTPAADAHAATKSYVDSSIGGAAATSSASCNADATCEMNGATLNGGNITGVNKITVTTIDPLYQIGTSKYATYVASVVGGVKEEFVGKAKLNENREYVIDFGRVREGSDLWVWRKAVDFSKDNVEVFVTPYGEIASIYYKIEGEKIIFGGDKPAEFSYRLIGKRFDWRKWPTYALDQSEKPSFIIK